MIALPRSLAAFRRGARPSAGQPGRRLVLIDVARGTAVVAMVIYHAAWDLSELRLIATDIRASPAWTWFAHAIAASFLVLVGIGLVLAQGRARPGATLARFGQITLAALLVTVGTYLVFPGAYVFFGILHCIALSSLLALPLRRASVLVTLGVAALVFAAPLVLTQPIFDAPLLAFLGLGTRIPTTNDYVPLAPWFGFVLAGIAGGRVMLPLLTQRAEGSAPPARPRRALAFVGRHSLLIYLLHQPLLFGAMSGWVEVFGRSPTAEAAPFLKTCERSCREGGEGEPICRATCACAVDAFKIAGLWSNIVRNQATPEERNRISATARMCFEGARGATSPRPPD